MTGDITDIIAAGLILGGGVFGMLGGLGLLRMPDVLIRMHAATKIGTLGCGLVIAAAAVVLADWAVTFRVILIVLFLLLTAPIGAHMIGRSVIRAGVPLRLGGRAGGDAPTDPGT